MEACRMGAGAEKEEGSECSSGCESGWTMYLDQSDEKLGSVVHERKCGSQEDEEGEEEEEEDLSMVSDASSGPPHCHDDDMLCYCNHLGLEVNNACLCSAYSPSPAAFSKKDGKRRRVGVETQQQKQREESCGLLDDTASSPFSPKKVANMVTVNNQSVDNVLEISHGFSATHFKPHLTGY